MALTSGVIEFFDESGQVMVQRMPKEGSGDFKTGTFLVVRESQEAVFFRDGKALDTFGPGRHQITTGNIPLLTKLISLPLTGGESPFKAEVMFVNKKTFTDEKWGTEQPVIFRDTEFGMVRLRAFGIFSHKIKDISLFINKIVGTQATYTSENVKSFLKNMIVGRLNDALGEVVKTVLDLAKYYDEIGVAMKSRVRDDFEKYGVELVDFIIKAITPPEEVQKAIDERSAMGAIGNMQQYMMFKSAKAMQDAANNQSAAGMGMGMGAGIGMGMMMPGMMMGGGGMQGQQPMQQQAPMQPQGAAPVAGAAVGAAVGGAAAGAPAAGGAAKFCTKCGAQNGDASKFCANCGNPM
ncbi:MAG: SPFH domain-containing protein [Spirochaetes bacterium]|nr:SPFH domain-containing protein [Spirochaetota bacterium]